MALRLDPPAVVKVDQALHGYADGHRQLALSTEIKPADLKTLLVMSDASGPGMRIAPATSISQATHSPNQESTPCHALGQHLDAASRMRMDAYTPH